MGVVLFYLLIYWFILFFLLIEAFPSWLGKFHEEWRGRHWTQWIQEVILPQVKWCGDISQPGAAAAAAHDRRWRWEVARCSVFQLPEGVHPVPAESWLPYTQHFPSTSTKGVGCSIFPWSRCLEYSMRWKCKCRCSLILILTHLRCRKFRIHFAFLCLQTVASTVNLRVEVSEWRRFASMNKWPRSRPTSSRMC